MLAVATITELNQEAATMASRQASITEDVAKRLSSIQNVGNQNSDYARQVAQNCAQLVDEISSMQQQLKRYRF